MLIGLTLDNLDWLQICKLLLFNVSWIRQCLFKNLKLDISPVIPIMQQDEDLMMVNASVSLFNLFYLYVYIQLCTLVEFFWFLLVAIIKVTM